ncbi:MAG: YwaF family protein [Acholeplasmataceae bacterium]|jgi:uncharacterized membrane protein YwaF|nr:YwaF family protein [Acholeplasmataceae bacterium]
MCLLALNFFQKFFGYYYREDGSYEAYTSGGGAGAFSDWRHYFWMVLVIVLGVGLYKLFRKYPRAGKITVSILLGTLFSVRLVNQIIRAIIGAEYPALRAFPFHLCTVMTFMLPIVYFFKLDKLKTAVYVLSMMGGIITIIVGDYFSNSFLTFSAFEGITAHSLLVLVPIIEIALGHFKLEYKNIWQVFVGILLLIGWAALANEVFFKEYNTNYMYLKRNALPGNIGGDYYFLIYSGIFLVMLNIIFGSPTLYRYLKHKKTKA